MQILTGIIDFLNKNSGALMVIFTGVVTISTIVYAILTWRLVSETRRMREVQTEPKIQVTLKPMEVAINIVRLHIRNIGLGPATNVKFCPRVLAGGDAATTLLEEFTQTNFFKSGLSYFGPGQELYSGYTQMNQDTNAKLESIFIFDLEYNSATGKKYKDRVIVDMSEQKGMYQLGTPNLYSIAQSLKKIQEEFSRILSGFSKINVNIYTARDRSRQCKERLEAIERQRKKKTNS